MSGIKFITFMPDESKRLQKITAQVETLLSGKEWKRFEPHIDDQESLLEQLKHLLPRPEPEQRRIKELLLLNSSYLGKWRTVNQLLDMAVDPNCKSKTGAQTPLQLASLSGQVRNVQAILTAPNIDVNTKDAKGNTALMCAAQNGCDALVSYLLEVPAIDVLATNNRNYNALDIALANGHQKIVLELEKFCSPELIKESLASNKEFYQACCFKACERGWIDILKFLDKYEMPLTIYRPESNANLVFTACLYQQDEVFNFLIKKNLPMDEPDGEGWNPLFGACQSGNMRIIEILCQAKCNMDRQDLQARLYE